MSAIFSMAVSLSLSEFMSWLSSSTRTQGPPDSKLSLRPVQVADAGISSLHRSLRKWRLYRSGGGDVRVALIRSAFIPLSSCQAWFPSRFPLLFPFRGCFRVEADARPYGNSEARRPSAGISAAGGEPWWNFLPVG